MRRIAIAGALMALAAVFWAGDRAEATPADCRVYDTPPDFVAGTLQTIPCDTSGAVITVPSGGAAAEVDITGVGGNPVTTSVPVSGAVSLSAPTTGGCTPAKTLSAASTNATSIKGSAGTLCSLTVINTNAAVYYLKLYNVSSAPTCNSSTVVQTIPVPASTTGAGVSVDVGPYGWAFSTGIGLCLTGGLADNDNTNAATGVAISYSYK